MKYTKCGSGLFAPQVLKCGSAGATPYIALESKASDEKGLL
jgi:hypothetical protein